MAYRVLMVWVYERTGSLLVAMLMHVSLATFMFILTPPLGGRPYGSSVSRTPPCCGSSSQQFPWHNEDIFRDSRTGGG